MTFAVLFLKDKDDEQPQLTADPGESHTEETLEGTTGKKIDLVYSLNDRPPWYLCILLGFQVNLSDDLFSPVSQQKKTLYCYYCGKTFCFQLLNIFDG